MIQRIEQNIYSFILGNLLIPSCTKNNSQFVDINTISRAIMGDRYTTCSDCTLNLGEIF